MSLYSIIVVNTSLSCDNYVEQQLDLVECKQVIVRVSPNTNAEGPFNVYLDSTETTPVYVGKTKQEMIDGVVVSVGPCPEPIEIFLIFQDGREWGTQGTSPFYISEPLKAQQTVTTYSVSSGFSNGIDSCSSVSYPNSLYSAVQEWEYVVRLFTEPQMNNGFNGNNLWYKNNSSSIAYQIDNSGHIINSYNCA